MSFMVKDGRTRCPVQWNLPEMKLQRQRFANRLMGDGLHVPRGDRAVRIVDGQRGKNVTLCPAVSAQIRLVHGMTIEGDTTLEIVSDLAMEFSHLLQ